MAPKAVIPEWWREWLEIRDKMTVEERIKGAKEGEWPSWVPDRWVEVYKRTTPLDHLIWKFCGEWPTIEEVMGRTPVAERQSSLAQRSHRTIIQEVEEILARLTDEERQVIDLRFGLKDGRFRTLQKVASEMGCSLSTVWRIEKRALGKLRAVD